MAVAELPKTVTPSSSFRKQVEEKSGEKVSSCYQCQKCSNGCPLAFAMDIVPHRTMRCIQLGLKDEALKSDTIWICASCETCTTRCPNGIDIAHIMDSLRQISQSEKVEASQKQVPLFHKTFLGSMRRYGRVHEGEMAALYTLRSSGLKGLFDMAGMGIDMLKKGKVKLLPHRPNKQVRNIFKAAGRKG